MNSQQRKQHRDHKNLIDAGRNATATLHNAEKRLEEANGKITNLEKHVGYLDGVLTGLRLANEELTKEKHALEKQRENLEKQATETAQEVLDLISACDDKNKTIKAQGERIIELGKSLAILKEEDRDASKLRRRLQEKTQEIADRDRMIRELKARLSVAMAHSQGTLILKTPEAIKEAIDVARQQVEGSALPVAGGDF